MGAAKDAIIGGRILKTQETGSVCSVGVTSFRGDVENLAGIKKLGVR